MKKLRKEFNRLRENQEEFNQSILDRFVTIDDRVKSLEETEHITNEGSQPIDAIDTKTQRILDTLISYDERIRRLEDPVLVNCEVANQRPNCLKKTLNNSKFKKINEITKKFAASTTFYGITRVVRAKSVPSQIIWTLLTLISLSVGLYNIAKCIKDFYEYDVFTQTKWIEPESNMLSAVTFCSDADHTDLNSLFKGALFIDKNGSTNLTGVTFHEGSLVTSGSPDGYHCIKFNNYRNKKNERLFYNNDPNYDFFKFEINLNMSFTTVFRVFLSDSYLNILNWSQLVTHFGDKTRGRLNIVFTKSIEHKLEEPYNDCQLIADETYRQVDCIADCKNKKAITKYNCTLKSYYYSPDYKYCPKGISELFQVDLDCGKQCPRECTSVKIEGLTSIIESSRYLEESLVIWVYPVAQSYLETSQTPKMTGFSLISETGGALGLFVGLTVLSFFEFLEYLSEIFLVLYL